MKLRKQFSNLKKGAKKVFIGMLVLCLVSTATGIGSIFAYADECENHYAESYSCYDEHTHIGTCVNCGKEIKAEHSFNSEGECTVCGYNPGPTNDNDDDTDDGDGSDGDDGSGDGGSGDGDSSYGAWDKNDETTHIRYNDAGESQTQEHQFTDWVSNGNGVMARVCTVCGYMEEQEDTTGGDTHTHTYTYTDNGDGTHTAVCSECEDTKTEAHNLGRWISDGRGNHTRTCALCDYSEVEPCSFDENGICTVCEANEADMIIASSKKVMKFSAKNLFRGLGATASGLEESGSGPVAYHEFYDELPVIASGLVYNGAAQDLFESTGTYKTDLSEYSISNVSSTGITLSAGTGLSATDANTYTATETISYKDSENTDCTAIGTFTITIAPASFSDSVTLSPDTDSYVELPNIDPPYYDVQFNGTNLVKDTDFTVSGAAFDTYPTVGDSRTYTLTGMGNFDNSTITKTVEVKDVSPTFNRSTELRPSYYGTVRIEPPTGYTITLSDAAGTGPSGSYVDYINLGNTPPQPWLYFKRNVFNQKQIKKQYNIVFSDLPTIDDLITTYPVLYPTVDYTGSDIDLMSAAPVLNQDRLDEGFTINWYFKEGTTKLSDKTSPKKSALGTYSYTFNVTYVTPDGMPSPSPLVASGTFDSKILKNIASSDITFTAKAADYQSLDSSVTDFADFYDVKDTTRETAQQQLQKNVDYDVTADKTGSYFETGTEITLFYEGITNVTNQAYYKGTTTKKITVSPVDVLINGKAQATSYDDEIVITASGYTISNKFDGTYNTQFKFSNPCTDYTLPLYFKKNGTSRVVKQDIKKLNIGPAAAVKVLYDGEEERKPFYYDSVRISAEGYWVKRGDTGSFTDEVYLLDYDTEDTLPDDDSDTNPVTDFDLYFKNKSTGLVSTKRISGIILFKSPTIDIFYNGEEMKDWYNGPVTITAKDTSTNPATIYKIASDANKDNPDKYSIKYVLSGTGTVGEQLYFIPRADDDTTRREDAYIAVSIDKTAPTGVINLSSYSSDSFTTKDAVKAYTNGSQKATISASDALSGVDYIHYYVSDTFYASPSDVKAAITEKSGAWRTYSSSSQPALVKDKNNYIYAKIIDKAGNETIISLGNILYDTVAPKMTTAKVAPSTTDTSKTLIGLAGTDKLSGINRFKYVFKEKEEGKKYDTPDKDWMFDNGEYVKTSDEKDGTSVASATIDALDPEKTYLFYFIAVDRAGNISDVMTQEVKGEAASAKKEETPSGSGASGKSGANGLTPAPNGIAGGGSGSGKQGGGSGSSGSGSSKSSKDKKSQSALGDKDREINRNPYIAEATGNVKIGINETSGWNKIASEVNKANKGAVIEVEMAGLSNVSNELFTSMNNRDVQVKLRMAEDVEWEIKGEEVPNARNDIDMGVRLGSRNIPEQILTDVAGTNPHVEFSINHDGDFGFVATIAVPVGESNKGMYTTLYHYDETKKELEVAGDGRVDDRGYAKFPLTHASDYTVVITPERILSAADTDAQTSTLVGAEAESQSSQYLDGARLRLTDLFRIKGSMRIWLFFIALLSATTCVIILYLPALQSRNQNDQGDLF